MSERFTEDGRRRITESAVISGQDGVPLVRIIENDSVASVTNDVQWNAAISSETSSPAVDARSVQRRLDEIIEACWTVALTPYFSSSAETLDAHIAAHDWWYANRLREAVKRLEREDADSLAELVAPGVPPSAVRDRLNPLHAALEPSLFEDDPDKRAAMRETALALSALHYAEITKPTRGTMEKAALLRERVLAEEPLARAFVRRHQDTKSKPAKRIETLVRQRLAETLGISVRQVQRILSQR